MRKVLIQDIAEKIGASADTIRQHFGSVSGEVGIDSALAFLKPRRCAAGRWTAEQADAADAMFQELNGADVVEELQTYKNRLAATLEQLEKAQEKEDKYSKIEHEVEVLVNRNAKLVLLNEELQIRLETAENMIETAKAETIKAETERDAANAEINRIEAAKESDVSANGGLIVAVIVLCVASITSVGAVLTDSFPVWWVGYLIAAVVCTAPVLVLFSKRLSAWIAYATMAISFLMEVACNSVAVFEKTQSGNLPTIVNSVSLGHISNVALAWLLGISLPALALCFEVLLLRHNRES